MTFLFDWLILSDDFWLILPDEMWLFQPDANKMEYRRRKTANDGRQKQWQKESHMQHLM